jgi:hypothetical protein
LPRKIALEASGETFPEREDTDVDEDLDDDD